MGLSLVRAPLKSLENINKNLHENRGKHGCLALHKRTHTQKSINRWQLVCGSGHFLNKHSLRVHLLLCCSCRCFYWVNSVSSFEVVWQKKIWKAYITPNLQQPLSTCNNCHHHYMSVVSEEQREDLKLAITNIILQGDIAHRDYLGFFFQMSCCSHMGFTRIFDFLMAIEN